MAIVVVCENQESTESIKRDTEGEEAGPKGHAADVHADSGRSGALIPFEVGQHSAAMWGRIPLGSGALFGL